MRRVLWLARCWFWTLVGGTLKGGFVADQIIREFAVDVAIFEALKAYPNKDSKLQKLVQRHVFQKVLNQQLIEAMKDLNWKPNDDFKQLCQERCRSAAGNKLVEDIFGVMENSTVVKTAHNHKRLEHAMFSAVSVSLIGGENDSYKYDAVIADHQWMQKGQTLCAGHFKDHIEDHSLDSSDITSTQAAASWYSPCASDRTTPHVGLRATIHVSIQPYELA